MTDTQSRTIYLAGGCFWGVEELFRRIPGVIATCPGYANGTGEQDATYQRVCEGDTGFRETVRVEYDPQAIGLDKLLWAYFSVIDPSTPNQQGHDVGAQYQAGIYWCADDEGTREQVLSLAGAERAQVEAAGRAFVVELKPLENFFDAEEYHQKYLVKNPNGYCHIPFAQMAEVLQQLG